MRGESGWKSESVIEYSRKLEAMESLVRGVRAPVFVVINDQLRSFSACWDVA
jgi:hypothetical protein